MELIDRASLSTVEKSEKPEGNQDLRYQFGPSANMQSSSLEETLQRFMEQTNNDCRFRIFISANSLHLPRLLSGR